MKAIDIIVKYPKVFGVPPYDPRTNLLCFGFECGKGWYPLIEHLASDINGILEKEQIEMQVTQVKEKFGSLSFYYYGGNQEIQNLVSKAEEASYTVCETCGAPGTLRKNGWYEVKCDQCYNNKTKFTVEDYDDLPITQDSEEEGL